LRRDGDRVREQIGMSNETETTTVVEKTGTVRVNSGKKPLGNGFIRIIKFLAWVFTGFGLIPALIRGGGQGPERRQEITVYSAHRAFNLWALIAIGFIGAWSVKHWPPSQYPKLAIVFGWIYVWTLVYTFVTLLFDFGALKLLLWVGVIALIWVAAKYLEVISQIGVLRNTIGYFRNLHPMLDPGFAKVMSFLLLFPWFGALFHTFTNGRKRFTPNEITEWYIGEGTELLDRAGLKFRTRYRDVLEMILGFGAGDLVAQDNRGNPIKKFENILFLIFLWPKLDSLLQERQTIVDTAPGDTLQVAESHHHHDDQAATMVDRK
jgi:hypothetical protein